MTDTTIAGLEVWATGLPALERLFTIAQRDTGESRRVANFLPGVAQRRGERRLGSDRLVDEMDNNNHLQQAIQNLINAQAQLTTAQATLTQTQTSFLERMAQVEADFQWIKATLIRHEQMLQNLPDAVKAKIGFQGIPRVIG